MTAHRGTIVDIYIARHRGIVRGDDGREHPFRRDEMALYMDFRSLKLGDRVSFEIDANGDPINIERSDR